MFVRPQGVSHLPELTMEEAPEEMEVRPMAHGWMSVNHPIRLKKKHTLCSCGPKYVNLLVNHD